MDEKLRILLCEDDENLGMLLREYLQAKNFETELCPDGEAGYKAFLKGSFDLCVLDVMMPKKDGFSLAKDIRQNNSDIPIIFLTAKTLKEDVLDGFKIGADDYITKPFSMEELVFRIEAILRRVKGKKNRDRTTYKIGSFTFDTQKQILARGEKQTKLTTKESELLSLLCAHANEILQRDFALKTIWIDDNYFNARSMDVYITKLRKHLKVERTRWYYHCDRMGMLVCQDAVQGGSAYNLWHTSRKPTVFSATWGRYRDDIPHHRVALSSDDARYQLEWTATCADMVRYLAGHPSIVAWSLFNEGMGQFDACAAAELVHTIDPTRPLDAASGWYDQHCGDVYSHHNYFRPLTAPRDRGRLKGYARERGFRAFLLSEFGGWAQPVEGHRFSDAVYGYGDFASPAAWRAAVSASLAEAEALAPHGLAGYVYTQLSDVEDEANGILTYDRRVNKLAAPDDEGAGV